VFRSFHHTFGSPRLVQDWCLIGHPTKFSSAWDRRSASSWANLPRVEQPEFEVRNGSDYVSAQGLNSGWTAGQRVLR